MPKAQSISFYEKAVQKKTRQEASVEYQVDRAIERLMVSLREKWYERALLKDFVRGVSYRKFYWVEKTKGFNSYKSLEESLAERAKEFFAYSYAMKNGLPVCIFYKGTGSEYFYDVRGKDVYFTVKINPEENCEEATAEHGEGYRHVHIMKPGETT